MLNIKLYFLGPFLLKDFNNYPNYCPEEKGGIYFHYIKNPKDNTDRIIYVGECVSFKLRQKDHLLNYDNFRSTLFEIEDGELNIKYIPDYDSPKDYGDLKKYLINNIYVICGVLENSLINTKSVEGAIVNYLYKNSATRKFLLNTTKNYNLLDAKIVILNLNIELYGLGKEIMTPIRLCVD